MCGIAREKIYRSINKYPILLLILVSVYGRSQELTFEKEIFI